MFHTGWRWQFARDGDINRCVQVCTHSATWIPLNGKVMLIFSRHASAVIAKHLSVDDSGQGACSLCSTWEQKNQFLIVSCVASLWEWQSLAHKSAAVVPVFTSTSLCQSNFLFSLRNELYGRVCRVSVPWYYEKWWSWQDDNVVIIKCDVCICPQRLYVLAFRQESFFFFCKESLSLV